MFSSVSEIIWSINGGFVRVGLRTFVQQIVSHVTKVAGMARAGYTLQVFYPSSAI